MATSTVPVRTQADALALVQETIEFYGKDPEKRRAFVVGWDGRKKCVYVSADGRKCAVGRCLTQPKLIRQAIGRDLSVSDIARFKAGRFQSLFKPEYRGYPLEMWEELQRLHDSERNWSQTGLSPLGEMAKDSFESWIRNESGLPA